MSLPWAGRAGEPTCCDLDELRAREKNRFRVCEERDAAAMLDVLALASRGSESDETSWAAFSARSFSRMDARRLARKCSLRFSNTSCMLEKPMSPGPICETTALLELAPLAEGRRAREPAEVEGPGAAAAAGAGADCSVVE